MKNLMIIFCFLVLIGLEAYSQTGHGFLPKTKRTKAQFTKAFSATDQRTINMVASQLEAVNKGLMGKGYKITRRIYPFLVENTAVVYGSYLVDTLHITRIINHYTIGNVVYSIEEKVVRTGLYGVFSYDDWDVYNIVWCKWLCGNSAWPVNTPALAPAPSASVVTVQIDTVYKKTVVIEEVEVKQQPYVVQRRTTVRYSSRGGYSYRPPQYRPQPRYQSRPPQYRPQPRCQQRSHQYRPRPQQNYATGPGGRSSGHSTGTRGRGSNYTTGPGGSNSGFGHSTGTYGRR